MTAKKAKHHLLASSLTRATESTPTCTCRKERLPSEIQNLKMPGWEKKKNNMEERHNIRAGN